jgi:3-hydroxyacyl-CoA dehydrogenase
VSQLVELRRDGNVAVIVIENPPVNALSNAIRRGLIDALAEVKSDASVAAAVLACAGRTFIAGADINEFGKPPQRPITNDVIETIEGLGKPMVAALHGTTFGGGLEIALGCHFRIAAQGTRLGQPEIKLGIIPGAGGTQRLPRLVGIEKGLAMVVTGDPIAATEALELGLIDELFDGESIPAGVAFARKVVAEKRPLRLTRDRDEKIDAFKASGVKYDDLAAKYVKRGRVLDATAAAIEAVRHVIELPVDEGLKREREGFLGLVGGDQARAQRHIFFAEREAAKVPDLAGVKGREVKNAAVIGAGTMGGGIAMSFANAGVPVTLIEVTQDALSRGLGTIAKNYQGNVARGSLKPEEAERRIGLIKGDTDFGAVAGADLVIEAVFEEMDIKNKVFGDLDRLSKSDAVLATNTSYLDVDAIAHATRRPHAVVGMHFFSPANVMRLLEVVRGKDTSPEALATAIAVGRKIGKVPVVVGVCHGFVGNRMHRQRSIEAERLLLEGALPREVDAAMTEFGFPMGPFAASDLAGLDISWRMRKAQGARAEIADALCEMQRFGQKSKRGFYLYEEGSRTPKPDPEVERLIVETSARLGMTRRHIDAKEIVERILFPMVNEGARILDEKIAQRPGDIDVIWVYGYGFPAWRGGPMHYADTCGLAHVCERLRSFAATTGDLRHTPAPLLERLAAEAKGFAALGEKAS